MRSATILLLVLLPSLAAAQASASRPGPYVIDVRGAMAGLPTASAFHPAVPSTTRVPRRGFGMDVGGHVYLASLGLSRIGVGLDFMQARGTSSTAPGVSEDDDDAVGEAVSGFDPRTPIRVVTTIGAIVPQISFNFGTREGWSYLSGGYGVARIRTSVTGTSALTSGSAVAIREYTRVPAINYGGGARWFIREHLAVGFDLRVQRMKSDGDRPAATSFLATAGFSIR